MSKQDGRGESLLPSSLVPETGVIDAHWDDDSIEGFISESAERPDPFERVTTVPDVPTEEYVKRIMAEADHAERELPNGDLNPDDRKTPIQYLSAPRVPIFSSGAPPPARQSDLDPLSLDLDEQHDGPHIEVHVEESSDPAQPAVAWSEPTWPGAGRVPEVRSNEEILLGDMKDRYAMGDFSGALVAAEALLESDPEHVEARRFAHNCRDVLTQMYSARLGMLTQTATIVIPADQIRWLSLDHRAGFLLSLVDGISTIEEILDVSGMSRLDALRIMCTLLEQRVIAVGDSERR